MSTKRKIVETFKQTYRRHTFVNKDSILPTSHIPPLVEGAAISDIEIRAAGHCEVDGKKREFMDVRIFVVP